MFSLDEFIFFEEVIIIVFEILFFFFLLCKYSFRLFKNSIILLEIYKKQVEFLLRFKFFEKKVCKGIKDKILKIFYFIFLLYIIKNNKINSLVLKILITILNSINFKIFIFSIFFVVCVYIGYIKVNLKKKTFLFLRFKMPFLFLPFYFFLEGYFCIWFFILYPFCKIFDFFFTCLINYFENLYYNLLPKFNLLLVFFVWGMLSCLEKTNKYQILCENFLFSGFLLIFFCYFLVYLKKNKKMLFLTNAYLSCINFFIAICIFFVGLIETFKAKIYYKIELERFITENSETRFVICFIVIVLLTEIFFIYNKELFLNLRSEKFSLKKSFYNFKNFFIKNVGYFFFNGFAIGRVMVGGIIKNTTEGIVDTNLLEAIENAKFEPPKRKELVIPKTQEEFVVFVADNPTEIRKDRIIRDACRQRFLFYKENDLGFSAVTQATYDEFESAAKFLMINGKRSILLGNVLPLWYPESVAHGPDAFMTSQNLSYQIKTVENMTARNIAKIQNEYGENMSKGFFKVSSYFVYITEDERYKMLRRYNKCPHSYASMVFTDSTTLPPSNPEDFVLMKKIAIANEDRMNQIRNVIFKEAMLNPNRLRQGLNLLKK